MNRIDHFVSVENISLTNIYFSATNCHVSNQLNEYNKQNQFEQTLQSILFEQLIPNSVVVVSKLL